MRKIPFFVVENFISPLSCEAILNDLRVNRIRPNIGQDGYPKKMVLSNVLNSMRLANAFEPYIESLENHFEFEYKGIHDISFEWFPEQCKASPPKSDGVVKTREGEWKRYREIDFTGLLWLNDLNEQSPFDPEFEVFGGKLEFPTFDISFNPSRGTLIVFPVASNFIYTVSNIKAGSLTQAKFVIRSEVPYTFDRTKFDCDIRSHFLNRS